MPMTVGKITIESGNYKAIFDFVDEKCTINFYPNLDLNTQEKTEEQMFVENTAGFIANYLMGNDE